jgi:hypothetical protein
VAYLKTRKEKAPIKNRVRYTIMIYLTGLILLVLFFWLNGVNPDFADNTIVKLNTEVSSITDGLPHAEKRAKQWNQDTHLSAIRIVFEGKQSIVQKSGIIEYVFGRNAAGYCRVAIDMKEQSISKVSWRNETNPAIRQWFSPYRKINPMNWNVDIEKVFNIIYQNYSKTFYSILNGDEPIMQIYVYHDDYWIVEMEGKNTPEFKLKIDSQNLSFDDSWMAEEWNDRAEK